MKNRLRMNAPSLVSSAVMMAGLAIAAPWADACGGALAGLWTNGGAVSQLGLVLPLNEMGEAGLQYLTVSSLAGIFALASGRFRRD